MPDFGPNAVKDMRAYVSHGMRHSGTMLFMGGRETNQAETLHEHQGEEGGRRNRQGHAGTSSQGGTRSSVEVHLINDIFGYQLEQDFKPGPYYKNERGVQQTALATLPSRVNELGNTESLGVVKSSMPSEARSYYDSQGSSVAMCAR